MRHLLGAMLIGVACIGNAAQTHPVKDVDLNDPRALGRLANDDPALYAKIRKILGEAGDQPPEQVGRRLKASFDAEDAKLGHLLKTSYPPKAELSFILGDTRYRAEVTLRNVRPKLIPAELHVTR
jgi:hypothetical protein